MNNTEILNEVYFGEQPELSQALVYLGLFRKRFINNWTDRSNFLWGTDKNLDKFDTCIAEFFGFKSFYLNVIGSMMPNAYTTTCKYAMDSCSLKARIKKTNKGYKYNGMISAIVNVYSAFIFNKTYSDREVFAIILHEIGHCFANKLVPMLDIEGKIMGCILFPFTILSIITDPLQNFQLLTSCSQRLREYYIGLKKNEVLSIVLNSLYFYYHAFQDALVSVIAAIPGLSLLNIVYLKNQRIRIDMPFAYLDENIADNFATMYGFGPELSSALTKMQMNTTMVKEKLHEIPLFGVIYTLTDIPMEFVNQIFDEHPTMSTRRKSQYNYLIRELDKEGCPPKLKNEIKKEIDRMEKMFYEIEHVKGKYGGRTLNGVFNRLLDRLKKGDDLRAYIFPEKYLDRKYEEIPDEWED